MLLEVLLKYGVINNQSNKLKIMKKSLQNKLEDLVSLLELGLDEDVIYKYILDLLYEKYTDNTLELFLKIQQLEKDRIKKEKQILYMGLQDAMHGTSSLGKHLLEDKTSRQAKDTAKWYFEPTDGNITSVIFICKAYFTNGKSDGASNNGVWFFNKFLDILKTNKSKYLPGGDSYQWAKTFELEDYINLVIKENDL